MNACVPKSAPIEPNTVMRSWLGSIDLSYEFRRERSALVSVEHKGPLRVQRPFYPEQDGTCHTYLLHPPGGMAVGDQLAITAKLSSKSSVLITTPSAGKMYGTHGVVGAADMPQRQSVVIHCGEQSSCEWLPQETIVFNAAMANLDTTIHLHPSAKFIGWDIIRLGRIASGEVFEQGFCHQRFQCYQNGKLIFRELNKLEAQTPMMNATWGLQGRSTVATMLATVILDRDQVDELYTLLPGGESGLWGLTQKQELFIARYLGASILDCRAGLNAVWHYLRPLILNKSACEPRIWNT